MLLEVEDLIVNRGGILSILFPLRAPFVLLNLAANSVFCFAGLAKCCEPGVWCLDGHWQLQIPSRVEAFARLAALANLECRWD
jgi:hypothetical protein